MLLAVLDRIFFNRNAILKGSTELIVLFIRSSQFCNQTNNKYLEKGWRDARVDESGNGNRKDESRRGRRLGGCAPNKELRIKKKGMLRRYNISLRSSVSRGSSIQPLCFFPTSNFHTIKGSPPTRGTYLRRAAYFLDCRRV